MRIKTLSPRTSLPVLRIAIVYPLTQCKADPLASSQAPRFEELLEEWAVTNAKKLALDDQAAIAQARRDRAGRLLNRVVNRVSTQLLVLTGGERSNLLYLHYFGSKTLADFKKPALSARLEAVKGWILSLQKSGQASLVAIVPELEAAVAEAVAADALKASAELEMDQFRDFGERKQLIDRTNAVCKSVHGELSKLPHEMLGLPNDYADRFFRPDRSGNDKDDRDGDGNEEQTIESVSEKIKEIREDLAAHEALLEELKAEKIESDKAAAVLEGHKTALAEIQKSIKEKEKLAEELEAKIEQM